MENQDLFAAEIPSEKQPAQKKLVRRSAVTDDALAHFREPYSAVDAARSRLRLHRKRQIRRRMGNGTPSRNYRQKIRHYQRRQRLGSRHHAQSALSARTAPARHHRQLGNAENRLCFAEAGYCVI